MKKISRILILGVMFMFIFSSCQVHEFNSVKIGDSLSEIDDLYGLYHLRLGALSVYDDGENYIAITFEDEKASAIAVFSHNKRLIYVNGLMPIDDENIKQFSMKSLDEVKKKYGDLHCDIGSGFYIPAYITEYGTIVFFVVENDIIKDISIMDIKTKEVLDS